MLSRIQFQGLKNKFLGISICVIISILFVLFTVFKLQAQDFKPKVQSEKTPTKLSLLRYSPVHPSCKDLSDEFEIRNCLSESISKNIQDNFDFNLFEGLDSERGIDKVAIFFNIDEFGKIYSIRSYPQTELIKNEAIRAVNKIPKMIPGKYKNGDTAIVKYSVLINYTKEKIEVKSQSGIY